MKTLLKSPFIPPLQCTLRAPTTGQVLSGHWGQIMNKTDNNPHFKILSPITFFMLSAGKHYPKLTHMCEKLWKLYRILFWHIKWKRIMLKEIFNMIEKKPQNKNINCKRSNKKVPGGKIRYQNRKTTTKGKIHHFQDLFQTHFRSIKPENPKLNFKTSSYLAYIYSLVS